MKSGKTRVLAVALSAVALLGAACGGDSGDEATGGTVDSGVREGVSDALTATTTEGTEAAPEPTSMEEWNTLWEQERQAIVDKVNEAKGSGGAGGAVTGTGGFKLDTSACPSGWSDTEGLTDTEIKIGHTTAQSGTLADYGNIARAMQVMIDEVNKEGGLKDSTGKSRKITLLVRDDGYDPARTIPLVDELIDSERVFAMITLGSPNTMRTYDKLNQRCVPHPFAMTGHPAWGDPENHPWTTGMQLAYNTEAVMWGAFIEQRLDELAPDGGEVTVAALVMNNDFGKSYDQGFKDVLATSTTLKDRVNYVTETIEPQTPTVTDAMTTLAAEDPDVFIAAVAGTVCTQAIQEADQNGMKENVKFLFQPSVCSANTFVGKDKVGESADGWWIVNGGLKDLNSTAFDDDPYIMYARDQLEAAGVDPASSGSLGSGYAFGWPLLQVLEVAGMVDGGLTRTNLMLAMRAMDMTHPFLLPGVAFNMNGNEDAYFVEGGVFQTRDAASDTWKNEGQVIDLSGKSKPCAWDQAAGVCN